MFQLPEFQNPALLRQALTHRSLPDHNERLEFLGDAILQGVLTSILYHQFPQDREGVLTEERKSRVSKPALATIARQLNLGDKLYMDANSEKQKCRQNPRILSGAFEAVIGAYFVDTDNSFDAVKCYLLQLSNDLGIEEA